MEQKKWYPWMVVGLLWVVALLNYMDRQMLSTMQQSIGLTINAVADPVNFGRLMAVFLWIYCFMSPVSGAIADRLNRKWLVVGSLGVWSAVTYLMGFCTTYDEIYWLRALMGVSEALYIPAALSLIAEYFTGKGRSLAIGIHMTGLYMGQALGGYGATIAENHSWQETFHWFGIIGVAYAVVLMVLLREKRAKASSADTKAAGTAPGEKVWKTFALLFSNIAFWVILFFFATSSLPGWAIKNWLPTLFAGSLDLTLAQAGPYATISIAAASFVGVMVGGPLSDRWVKTNVRGRIYTSAIGMAMMIPALICIGFHNIWAAVGAAVLFGVGYGMFDANNMPILCQFVPSHQRASAYGIMNMTGVLAGAVVTGVLGSWQAEGKLGLAFSLMGIILVVALALQLIVLRPKSDDASLPAPTRAEELAEDNAIV